MRPTTLLVTGFGPFPGVPVNPSADLAARVARAPRLRRLLGGPADLLVLPTTYEALRTDLSPALARGPDAVLMIGVARRAGRVRVEARAVRGASVLSPDAAGATGRGRAPAGPPVLRNPLAPRVLARLHGIGAVASRDAGRYLCNASYYRVLARGCPAVFLHIPFPPRGTGRAATLAAWTEAFVEAARVLTVQARRESVRRARAALSAAARDAHGGRPGNRE